MPYDMFQEGTVDAEDNLAQINPRDTYGDRFEVKQRAGSTSPKSPLIASKKRFRNSEKLFSRHHDANLGGHVNMKNVTKEENVSGDHVQDEVKKEDVKKSESDFRSAGLDSLFTSTTESLPSVKAKENIESKPTKEKTDNDNNRVNESFFEDKSSTSFRKPFKVPKKDISDRRLKVIKPNNFNTAASELSTALKDGFAVVLCIKNTRHDVANRILDFALGAASMCGAQVSVEADRTYAFTIGSGLSQRERLLCVKEGVPVKVEK